MSETHITAKESTGNGGAPDVVVGYSTDLLVISGTNPAPSPPDVLSTPNLVPLSFSGS